MAACKAKTLSPESPLVVDGLYQNKFSVVHVVTKTDWKLPSDIALVKRSLEGLAALLWQGKFESAAVPALGCGLGGLKWSEVRDATVEALSALACRVVVYAPT